MSTSAPSRPGRLRVDVWSDVSCPWCHLGLTYLQAAIDGFEHGDHIDVVLHSFQLDPGAPMRDDVPVTTRIARKYGTSEEQVEASQARIRAAGEEVGLEFNFDLTVRSNTLDAHRLLHLAAEHDRQRALKEELFRAYFTRGEVVGDPAVLRRLAEVVGLPSDAVEKVLDTDLYADDVRADVEHARQLGVTGVPFFLFDGDVGFGGAQPPDRMLRALQRLWAERRPESADSAMGSAADGETCGPEGCEV